ncbi:MAG: hypothetical protein HOH33_12080 [Verrucomicrobia bacterium]|nr:hypothetical protein [Verrucomicrobiota bacterium]
MNRKQEISGKWISMHHNSTTRSHPLNKGGKGIVLNASSPDWFPRIEILLGQAVGESLRASLIKGKTPGTSVHAE